MRSEIHIGTSGWNYDHWVGKFYPKNLNSEEWFEYYSRYFSTVEINNTFYQLPEEKTFKSWEKQAENNFIYAVKANRYITHMKNLKDSQEPLKNFHERYEVLKSNAGPILFQLPPQWNLNLSRLKEFVSILRKEYSNYKYALEFRNDSWYTSEVFALLEENNIALCIHDHKNGPSPEIITADFIYRRFHGTDGAYKGKYGEEELNNTAKFLTNKNLESYCYFNNDYEGFAVENAQNLKKIMH